MLDMLIAAIRSVRRKFFKTLLTAAGIAIGVASVVIINSVGDMGISVFNRELDSLGIDGIVVSANTKSTGQTLDESDSELLESQEYIKTAMPVINVSGKASGCGISEDMLVWGVNECAADVISLEAMYGRVINRSDVSQKRSVCLIDQTLSQKLFSRENTVGQKVTLTIGSVTEDYEIIGVVSTDSSIMRSVAGTFVPDFVYVPYSTVSTYCAGTLSEIAVRVQDGYDVDTAANRISRMLSSVKGNSNAVSAENLTRQRDRIGGMLNIVKSMLTAIGAISIVVSSLGIMNIMMMTVRERTREIGIKKSLGAKNSRIMQEFLFEAMIISLIGSAAGAIIGIAVTFAGAAKFGLTAGISVSWVIGAVAASVLLGALFGVYPALKAARMNPVTALGRE
jgi:putative ABC transport system permease protein